ncbi:MAG TPA: aminotransferase class I/II-fold pyridoxal phosphate-dependent enzyme, partial [Anaerolineaceae bacterium]
MNTAARIESLPGYIPTDSLDSICARLEITPDQVAKLDSNENPYGPSPRAAAALAELASPHFYPDAESRLLREALARFTGAPVETLLAGSGADELIDLMVRVVLDPGDRVITCPPTFEMYAFDTRLNHGEVVEIPRRADFSLDLPAIAAAVQREKPKILFIASPNNPDGSLTPPGEIDALLDLPVLVVLDEAYIEFTDGGGRLGEGLSRIQQVAARENLAVLRTFSKWAGLAGLR